MLAVMFDTNIFDKLLDDESLMAVLPKENFIYYATEIQYQQICAMPLDKIERKNKLKIIFSSTVDTLIEPVVEEWFNFSTNFHNTRFASENEMADYRELAKDKKSLADALILLTGKYSGNMIIISEDIRFPFNIAKNKGYKVFSLQGFLDNYKNEHNRT